MIGKFLKRKYINKEISPEDIFIDSSNLSSLDRDNLEGALDVSTRGAAHYFFIFITLASFFMFAYKSYSLQIVEHDYWSEKSANNYIKNVPIFAKRGVVKDRNGELLAWNSEDDSIGGGIIKREYKGLGYSNLLGYVSYPKIDKSGVFWEDEYLGVAGIEKEYNDYLSGVNGNRFVEVNVKKEIIRDNITQNPTNGETLELTIDSKLQDIFYKHLKEALDDLTFTGAAGAIMDVNTGEVLAMVSLPDYDNNIFVNASGTKEKEIKMSYLERKDTPMLNRVVSGTYTPGSVVKPFMAYAALDYGVIGEWDSIYSSGQLVIKNKYGGPDTIFRDWKAHGYVDARKAIAVSSDEYFYQVGGGFEDQKGLGIIKIDEYMSKFGFASTTNIDFPNEKLSLIPTPEWKKKTFADGDWLLGNTYHTSIGQYGYKTTPIALLRSIALIANGEYLISPILSKATTSQKIKLDLNKHFLNVAREGMKASASEGGTAHYFSHLPFEVAAKTGTAQLGVNNERVNSWTTGYWPYKAESNTSDIKPKYAFVLLLENGQASNTTGASVIMKRVFDDMIKLDIYTK